MNPMTILVTGGAGFIGSHITRDYIKKGHTVHVVDNLLTGNRRNLAECTGSSLVFHEGDICTFDFSSLPPIDLCFHMASPASPIQYKKYPVETLMTNSYGTYKLMEAMKQGTIKRLVLASTSEVYGDPLIHPQPETYFGNVNTTGPRACYDEAKRFAEAMVTTYIKKFAADVRIARIFNTYGPHMETDDGRVVSNFITQALAHSPITIYGEGEQTRSFCFVSDLVAGLIALGEKPDITGEIINLGNPEEKTMRELAIIIKNMTQSTSEIVMRPIDADDPKKRKPDITKAQQILQWNPTISLETGLAETITYFQNLSHQR